MDRAKKPSPTASKITSNMGCSLRCARRNRPADQPATRATLILVKMRRRFAVAGSAHLPIGA